jgi:hypothetical protein
MLLKLYHYILLSCSGGINCQATKGETLDLHETFILFHSSMWGSLKMCTSSVEVVGYKEKWRHCSSDQLTYMHSLFPAAQSRQLCIRTALDPCSHSFIFARADLILVLTKFYYVRFQVLTVASMKTRAFLDIAPCSFGVDWRFRGVYCLHHQGDDDGGSITPTRLHCCNPRRLSCLNCTNYVT